MYEVKKQYMVLAKEGEKIADAGLLKLTKTEHKLKVDLFLNEMPICYNTTMECRLQYRQRSKEGDAVQTKSWKECLKKENPHYMFLVQTQAQTEEIIDCRLILQGNYMVVSDEKLTMVEQTITNDGIRYIRDLDYLKNGDNTMQELFFNSFLLHGFYQYQYFILGKNFIGVPDHFYEREAVAAKMMGFPYFMEAEHLTYCELDGELRKELPKIGSFGYYLRKI